MPINVAELQAIFTLKDESAASIAKINTELDKLGTKLSPENFSLSGGNMDQKWESMRQKIGDVVPAVEDLGGKFGGLAGMLPEAAIVGGFAVIGVAAYEAGKKVLELTLDAAAAGDHLLDLSLKAGTSVQGWQALSDAWTIAGGKPEALGNALATLDQRLSTNADTVSAGLHKIGLETSTFVAMAPDQRMIALGKAIADTNDPVVVAGGLYQILGRQWRDMLPVLDDLNTAMQISSGITPFSEEDARLAKAFSMELRGLKLDWDNLLLTVGVQFIPAASWLLGVVRRETTLWLADLEGAIALWNVLSGTSPTMPGLPKAPRSGIDPTGGLNLAGGTGKNPNDPKYDPGNVDKDLASVYKDLNAQLKEQEANQKKANAAAKEWAGIMAELNSAGGTWQETLNGIDGETVSAVEYYLQAGVSQTTLAKAYDLTATQVKAVASELKAAIDQQKLFDKTQDEMLKNGAKLWKEYGDAVVKNDQIATSAAADSAKLMYDATHNALQSQIHDIELKAEKEKASVDKTVSNWREAYAAIDANTTLHIRAILLEHDKVFQAEKKLLNDISGGPGGWSDTFTQVLINTHSFKDAAKSIFNLLKNDVISIFSNMLGGIIQGFFQPLLDAASHYLGGLLSKFAGIGGGGKGGLFGGLGGGSGLLGGLFGGGGAASGGILADSGSAALLGGGGGAAGGGFGGAMSGFGAAAGLVTAGLGMALPTIISGFTNKYDMNHVTGGGGLSIADNVKLWNQMTPEQQQATFAKNNPNLVGAESMGVNSPEPPRPMAAGGSGMVDKPTLFLAGEAGPEKYAFGNVAAGGVTVIIVKDVEAAWAALPSGIKSNYRGLRTQINEALG